MNLELYQYYTRDEIFRAFMKSPPAKAEGWFLSSNRLIGLFTIGERPPDIHFCDNRRFHWNAPQNRAVPKPIQEFENLDGGFLFIKSPTADRYAYVAKITHVGHYGRGPDGCEAGMDVNPRIPTELLHELGGLFIHADSESVMNESVEALRAAKTPNERFAAFQSFVRGWRGPIRRSDALSKEDVAESKLPIPRILRKLYRWAGACDDVMSASYWTIRKPDQLSVDENQYAPFCVEYQWCRNYYFRKDSLRDEDPEVFVDECGETHNGAGYHGTGIGLSRFLWMYHIAFNAYSGPISYQVFLKDGEYQRFKRVLKPLPVLATGNRSIRTVGAYGLKLRENDQAFVFAKDGVMGYVAQEKKPYLVLVSKTQSSVDKLAALLGVDASRLVDSL